MELLKSTNYHLINFNFRSEVPATNEISVRGGEGKRQKEFVKLLWKFKVILEEALTEDIWKGEERVDFKAAMQKEWDMNRSSLRMKQVSRAFDQVSIDSLKGAIVKWMRSLPRTTGIACSRLLGWSFENNDVVRNICKENRVCVIF